MDRLLFGVPQGSAFDPSLFNVFPFAFFLFLHDIPVANYVKSNTPYYIDLKI